MQLIDGTTWLPTSDGVAASIDCARQFSSRAREIRSLLDLPNLTAKRTSDLIARAAWADGQAAGYRVRAALNSLLVKQLGN